MAFGDKFVNATHGIDKSLGAGEERMTFVANIDVKSFAGATDGEGVATGAGDDGLLIFWM